MSDIVLTVAVVAVIVTVVAVMLAAAWRRRYPDPPEYPSQLRHRQLEHLARRDRIR